MAQRLSGKAPNRLIASPLGESNRFDHLAGMPTMALLIIDPEQCRKNSGLDALTRSYQLTAAETRLLQALMQDQTPKQIAARLELSIHTVRSQLASLYAKAGVRSQRELVALVMRATLSQP